MIIKNQNKIQTKTQMTSNERFSSFLKEKRVSTKELASKLGLSHSAVSLIKSGRNHMSANTLEKLLEIFPDLCPKWLVSGNAPSQCPVNSLNNLDKSDNSKDDEIKLLRELLQTKNQVIELLMKEKG